MTNSSNTFWLTLEPYVYVSIKNNHALLYNTLSGEMLEYGAEDAAVIGLLKSLTTDANSGVIGINHSQIAREPTAQFIADLRARFMGDILDVSLSRGKPTQTMPLLKIHKDVSKMKKDPSRSPGEEIMTYLKELTLFAVASCDAGCASCTGPTAGSRQFTACRKEKNHPKELSPETIRELLREISAGASPALHVTGGNIFRHSRFEELTDILNAHSPANRFYLHYLHIREGVSKLLKLKAPQNHTILTIHFPVDRQALSDALESLNNAGLAFSTRFIVRDESEADSAEEIVQEMNIPQPFLQPWYDGTNESFFEKFVFIDKDTIQNFKPSEIEILARTTINTNYFGKLTVTPSGAVYADLNRPPLGRLGVTPLSEMIHNELSHGKSWLRVRKNLLPCKSCVFHAICPSPSQYETVMGRNHICKNILT